MPLQRAIMSWWGLSLKMEPANTCKYFSSCFLFRKLKGFLWNISCNDDVNIYCGLNSVVYQFPGTSEEIVTFLNTWVEVGEGLRCETWRWFLLCILLHWCLTFYHSKLKDELRKVKVPSDSVDQHFLESQHFSEEVLDVSMWPCLVFQHHNEHLSIRDEDVLTGWTDQQSSDVWKLLPQMSLKKSLENWGLVCAWILDSEVNCCMLSSENRVWMLLQIFPT